jgi:hypothetical protein
VGRAGTHTGIAVGSLTAMSERSQRVIGLSVAVPHAAPEHRESEDRSAARTARRAPEHRESEDRSAARTARRAPEHREAAA